MNTGMADKLDDDQDDAPSNLLDSSIETLLDPNTQQMMSEVRNVRRKVSKNERSTEQRHTQVYATAKLACSKRHLINTIYLQGKTLPQDSIDSNTQKNLVRC